MGRLVSVSGGDPFVAFEMAMYGDQHPNTYNFIQNQYDKITGVLDDASKLFISTAKDLSAMVNDSTTIRLAKAAINKLSATWQDNHISQYVTTGEIQNANETMRRYIMAQPDLRALYHKEQCDGFSGKYEDYEPGRVGDMHYDYRRVMDGVVVIEGADSEVDWTCTNYLDDIRDGDSELELSQQLAVLRTWSVFEDELQIGCTDPTDVFNGKL